jgi:hypothetical protein
LTFDKAGLSCAPVFQIDVVMNLFVHYSRSSQGQSAEYFLHNAKSGEHIESAIADLTPDFFKVSLVVDKNVPADVLVASAKAIAKSHIKNVRYHFFEGVANGFQESLAVYANGNKHFQVFDYSLTPRLTLASSQHFEQLFSVLNKVRVGSLKLDCDNDDVDKLALGLSKAKNVRGLNLTVSYFKKSDFDKLKNAIESHDSIQHLNVQRGVYTIQSSCNKFVDSLQGHLAKNARQNEFVDLFGDDRSRHFLNDRKGHQFISTFLDQVNLNAGSQSVNSSETAGIEKTDLISKALAKFLKPADAINMALTNKATFDAATSAHLSYGEVNTLRALYQSSARSTSEQGDSKPAAREQLGDRPLKRQKES